MNNSREKENLGAGLHRKINILINPPNHVNGGKKTKIMHNQQTKEVMQAAAELLKEKINNHALGNLIVFDEGKNAYIWTETALSNSSEEERDASVREAGHLICHGGN